MQRAPGLFARSCAAFAVVAVLIALPAARLWSRDFTLDGRDVHRIFRPAAYALEARLHRMELPEWEPTVACGQPLVGLGQSQLFYPPKWILLAVGPERTLALLAVLHPLFAAACAFALARRLRLRPAAAACAALVTGGTPLWLSSYVSPNLEYAVAWTPLALLLALRHGERPGLRDAALAGAAMGLQLLAGTFEVAFGTGLCCAAVALGVAVDRRRAARGVALMAAVALLLGAPELLPVAAHAREGPRRTALSLQEASRWAMAPGDVAGMALPPRPRPAGSLEEYKDRQALFDSVYLGATTWALCALGLLRGRRRFWAPLVALLVLLALGKVGGLFAGLHGIPGLDRMRYPAKFALLLAPLLALGAAQGARALQRLPRGWAAGFTALAALALVAADRRVGVGAALGFGLLAAAVALRLRTAAAPLALAALGVDLTLASSVLGVVPIERVSVVQRLRAEVPAVEPRFRLGDSLRDEDWWRLGQVSTPPEVDALGLNFPQSTGARLSLGYGPNISLRVSELYRRGGEGAHDLMGERLVLAMRAAGRVGAPVRGYGEAVLLSRPGSFPRGVFLTHWRVLPTEGVQREVLAPGFDPRAAVLLEERPPLPEPRETPRLIEAALEEVRPEEVSLRVDAPAPGIALLQDTWDPGWSATVDGRPATVLRADSAFMGVPMEAGPHVVTFRYASLPLRLGLVLALAGLVVIAAAQVSSGGRRRGEMDG